MDILQPECLWTFKRAYLIVLIIIQVAENIPK